MWTLVNPKRMISQLVKIESGTIFTEPIENMVILIVPLKKRLVKYCLLNLMKLTNLKHTEGGIHWV